MHPCLVASYDKPRELKAADIFFVPLPAGGQRAMIQTNKNNTTIDIK